MVYQSFERHSFLHCKSFLTFDVFNALSCRFVSSSHQQVARAERSTAPLMNINKLTHNDVMGFK